MSFIFKKTLDGSTPQYEEVPAAAVAIVANALLESGNDQGYADDATAATCITVVGVNEEAVDNSLGSKGDLNVQVITNPDAVFQIDTSDTMAQAQVGKTVIVTAGNLTITTNSAVTDETGIVKTRKFITAALAQGTIVFDGART